MPYSFRLLGAALLCGVCATPVPAAASETAGRWSALTALLAGTYEGNCTQQPEARQADGAPADGGSAALKVAAGGKVRAPGIDIDVDDSPLLHVERLVRAGVPSTSVALASLDEQSALMLGSVEGQTVARARDGKHTFDCQGIRLPAALSARALAVTLARRLDAAGTIACRVAPGEALRDVAFRLAHGQATLGEHTIDLTQATGETLVTSRDGDLQYRAILPGELGFVAFYDAAGKLRDIGILTDGKDLVACGPEA